MHAKAHRRRQRGKARIGQQILHQLHGLIALDAAAVVRADDRRFKGLALQRAEIDAQARLARLEHHAHARRLQRGAAGIAGARIVTKDGEDRRIASGGDARGHRLAQAEPAAGHAVNLRQIHRRKRGLAAQLLHGLVCDAVADNQHIFHGECASSVITS